MVTDKIRQGNLTALRRARGVAFTATSCLGLALVWVFTATTAIAAPRKAKPSPSPTPTATPKPAPNAPGNFRVTALMDCTVTVAWDPVNFTTADFNYHLSGTNQAAPAILPKTATSHTFTGLAHGSEYWFFIYARDTSGKPPGSPR
jgi:Fibronectin type III domain